MSALSRLFGISLNSYFGLSAMRIKYFRKKEELWEPILVTLAIVFGAIIFGIGVYSFAMNIAYAGAMIGQVDFVLTLFILLAQLLAFIFGLFAMISIFYFSNDLDILVPLPLQAWHILATKFSLVNITEYAPVSVVLVPTFLAYHNTVGLGVGGWVSAFVTMLLVPIVPLALAGILAVTVMRGVNRRHRDVLMVMASLVLVMIFFYLQHQVTAITTERIDPMEILLNRMDFVNVVGASFPPAIWATRAIVSPGTSVGLINLAYLVLSTVAAIGIFMSIGQKIFYGGLVGGAEKTRRGVVYTSRIIARRAVQSSPFKALLLREIKLFVRMPVWLMNGFLTVLLFPLMAFLPVFFGVTGDIESLSVLVQNDPHGLVLATLAVAAAITFMTSTNTLASTSITREGKHLWISKVIPVSAREQVSARLSLAFLAALLSSLPLIAVFGMLLAPGFGYMFMAFFLGISVSFTPQVLGLWFDMWRPFLNWSNPQHAVKNNLNAVVPMLLALPLAAGSYFAYTELIIFGVWPALFTLLAVHLALALTSIALLLRHADNLFAALEVKG